MSPGRWPFRRSPAEREAPAASRAAASRAAASRAAAARSATADQADRAGRTDRADLVLASGVCWACDRSDLPLDTAWDPPICVECDAQINEDEIIEELERGR